MKANDLMSRGASTCRASDSLAQAARIMWDRDCGCVPVVDDAGKLVGIITDRDVCMAAYTQGVRLEDSPVASAMSRNVACCEAKDSLRRVHELMRQNAVRRIPVIDADRKPIGLVSIGDLLRGAALASSGPREGDEVVKTLEAITSPHKRAARGEIAPVAAELRLQNVPTPGARSVGRA